MDGRAEGSCGDGVKPGLENGVVGSRVRGARGRSKVRSISMIVEHEKRERCQRQPSRLPRRSKTTLQQEPQSKKN